MIDYDLNNDFSDFITDSNRFFSEFNRVTPGNAVDHEDRIGICIAFLLSRISDSLMNIESAICKDKDK